MQLLIRKAQLGTSLVVQWLSLCTSTAGGVGLIPGQGTKIPHAAWPRQKKKKGAAILGHKTYISFSFASLQSVSLKTTLQGFPGGAVVENLPANAGDTGSSPGLGRSHMPRSN